jgi:hypothetical protein
MSDVIGEQAEAPALAEGNESGRVQTPIQVDEIGLEPLYTNFCRVTGTPEEVIIDFGLNTEPFGRSTHSIKLQQRIVSNFYTAKRLLMALSVAVQRHENAFGVLEIDVNKRLKSM